MKSRRTLAEPNVAKCLAFVVASLLAASLVFAQLRTPVQEERRAKCTYLWQELAPRSYAPEIVEWFVAEHERLGIGSQWLASFCYGYTNANRLELGKRYPGQCFSPMDVKFGAYARRAGCKRPEDLRDWRRNITAHCLEAQYGVSLGYRDLALCRYIMFPMRPHDWGGGRFRRTWGMLTRRLSQGFAAGAIGRARKTWNDD